MDKKRILLRPTLLLLALIGCNSDEASVPGATACASDSDCSEGSCQSGVCSSSDAGEASDADIIGGGDTTSGNDTDAPQDTGSGDDTSAPEDQGVFGAPCEVDSDCDSGYCIETSDQSVCTQVCSDACPEGWDCRLLVNSAGDGIELCMPAENILCSECSTDLDCGSGVGSCVPLDDGDFCATDCGSNVDCPEGYLCQEWTDDENQARSSCLPELGVCSGCLDADGDFFGTGADCLGPDCDDLDETAYPNGTELCDERDNDCDSAVDEGFNLDTDALNCGVCGNACTFDNAQGLCVDGACEMGACENGWVNRDGLTENGCEFICEVTGEIDVPDDNFADTNCDDIDGDAANAIFVSPLGNDSNVGTRERPILTLGAGINAASAQGKDVYIAVGNYNESSTIQLVNGVNIFGGYDATTWQRAEGNLAVVNVNNATAARAYGISSTTIVDRIQLIASNNSQTGGSSYGLLATNSDGLVLNHVSLNSGSGGAGSDGTGHNGNAQSGGDGELGESGCEGPGILCGGCSQPAPGAAGISACGNHGGLGGAPSRTSTGAPGQTGYGIDGGTGGQGVPVNLGDSAAPSYAWGRDGGDGSAGQDGTATTGTYGSSGYMPENASDGTPGLDGSGGGGGGGGGGGTGGGCKSYGGGGGGGGAGGCGGLSGTGGTGGGASIALYLWESDVQARDCTFTTAGGGQGGSGGRGQNGGFGGQGGENTTQPGSGNLYGSDGWFAQRDASNGGKGGDGGDGGRGGHGAGGSGGPSIGVYVGSSQAAISGANYNVGLGGQGGDSDGNAGVDGRTTNSLDDRVREDLAN